MGPVIITRFEHMHVARVIRDDDAPKQLQGVGPVEAGRGVVVGPLITDGARVSIDGPEGTLRIIEGIEIEDGCAHKKKLTKIHDGSPVIAVLARRGFDHVDMERRGRLAAIRSRRAHPVGLHRADVDGLHRASVKRDIDEAVCDERTAGVVDVARQRRRGNDRAGLGIDLNQLHRILGKPGRRIPRATDGRKDTPVGNDELRDTGGAANTRAPCLGDLGRGSLVGYVAAILELGPLGHNVFGHGLRVIVRASGIGGLATRTKVPGNDVAHRQDV